MRVYDVVLSQTELEAVRLEAIASAPAILQQPQNVAVPAGSNATFTVVGSGAPPLGYQWYFGANPIAGATEDLLTLTNVSPDQAGDYTVILTNAYGGATSRVAVLTLLTPGAPILVSALASPTRRGILLSFDRALADSATNLGNFSLTAGLSVLGASLEAPTFTNLMLITSLQVPNGAYTLTAGGLQSRAGGPAMTPVVTNLNSPPLYGPGNNVPESANWTLLYSLPLANTASYNLNGAPYSLDHHNWLTNVSRVAYYLELQQGEGLLQYVWVAMDAFTADPLGLGVPTVGSGGPFDQNVGNLDVRSSVAGIPTGTGLSGGSIKFLSGDDNSPGIAGRGEMQVKLGNDVLLAFNGWGNGGTPDLGVGNNTANTNADWSFMANAPAYTIKRLLVYVMPRPQSVPLAADVAVYGGTSGGVIAAVQAARMGKRVVLLCLDNHLGGLSSGGLGWTDIGSNGTGYIGGLALEFYRRNGARYNQSVRYNLEPHVAEQIFAQMLAEAGVQVVFNQRLASVAMNNRRITQLTMEDGSVYQGKMFIDTTYEGDLIAAAGVSYVVGREGTNAYKESFAGVLSPGNGGVSYSPYLVPGDSSSGLLPLVNEVVLNPRASADDGVQAYNYRMCFTQLAGNFLPITAPADYDESQFELLARYIEALVAQNGSVSLGQFMTVDRPPAANKYDINNNGQISTDLVGESRTWPTNTIAGRAVLRQRHEDYMRGFFTFLATSARVPANLNTAMQSWGMCQDEFLDTGGWPHAIYVREGRRMVSDYVMTQQDCQGYRAATNSIGLAAYSMDSHLIWRLAVNGTAQTEGGMFNSVPAPFRISYRSLVPRSGECENVFCTFALSASHVAFASCRMEPVFMITSQSAATAAAFAIDDNVPVQDVNYAKLSLQLQADGQLLGSAPTLASGIIVDDADATGVSISGLWTSSTAIAGYWGTDYLTDGNANKGGASVSFTPVLPSNGVYQVALRWTDNANRATNVPVDIIHPAGTTVAVVNQQSNGGAWVPLLTTNFNAGTSAKVIVRNDGTTGYVIADAVQFLPLGVPATSVQVLASVASTSEAGGLPGEVTFVRSGDTPAALSVNYTLSGTASNGLDYVALPGTITFSAGAAFTNVLIVPLVDALAEGPETVVLSLKDSAGYSVGPLRSATLTILDANPPQAARLVLPSYQAGSWQLSFLGTPGTAYEVQRSPSLPGSWTALGTVTTGPDGSATWIDTAPLTDGAFYRVAIR